MVFAPGSDAGPVACAVARARRPCRRRLEGVCIIRDRGVGVVAEQVFGLAFAEHGGVVDPSGSVAEGPFEFGQVVRDLLAARGVLPCLVDGGSVVFALYFVKSVFRV